MTDEQLLQEIDDILRSMPDRATLRHDNLENHSWFGRLAAAIKAWDSPSMILLDGYLTTWHGNSARDASNALNRILVLLHQARSDLRMKTSGPLDVAIDAARVYDYFDEIRKIIAEAKSDVFIIDPYLDAEFVAKYLGHVADGVTVRLLSRHKLKSLLPAVEEFAKQEDVQVTVRATENLHDRYVIIDKQSCYQSGASFKDGAKNAPTTITRSQMRSPRSKRPTKTSGTVERSRFEDPTLTAPFGRVTTANFTLGGSMLDELQMP